MIKPADRVTHERPGVCLLETDAYNLFEYFYKLMDNIYHLTPADKRLVRIDKDTTV